MPKQLFFPALLIAALFSLMACSSKLPLPPEQIHGMAAIPISVKNTSSDQIMSFRYQLKQQDETAPHVAVEPNVNQDFVFADNLEPGTYQFTTGRSIYSKTRGIADSNAKDFSLDTPITLHIRPGELFVADTKIEIHKYSTDRNRYRTKFNTIPLSEEERQTYITKLKEIENSNTWGITLE